MAWMWGLMRYVSSSIFPVYENYPVSAANFVHGRSTQDIPLVAIVSTIPYIRMKFEQNELSLQNLYNIPHGVEMP